MHDFGAGSWTSREILGLWYQIGKRNSSKSSTLPFGNQTWLAGKSPKILNFLRLPFFGGIFQQAMIDFWRVENHVLNSKSIFRPALQDKPESSRGTVPTFESTHMRNADTIPILSTGTA